MAKNTAVHNVTPHPANTHPNRARPNPPATTTDASNNAPPNGTHAYNTPAGPDRTTSSPPGFTTTVYVRPFRTATDLSITTRDRAVDPADNGVYGPQHVCSPHRDTSIVPRSRPFVSITCCAVPHEPHTPANRISTATTPIAPSRPKRRAAAEA